MLIAVLGLVLADNLAEPRLDGGELWTNPEFGVGDLWAMRALVVISFYGYPFYGYPTVFVRRADLEMVV